LKRSNAVMVSAPCVSASISVRLGSGDMFTKMNPA
jgi:hypothetical protein